MDREMLGPLERRVIGQLWSAGPSTVREVRDALNAVTPRPLAYTTVMTILGRLYKKGFLTRTPEGRHHRYAPVLDEASLPAEVGRRELRRLVERHGAATLAGFAADLADAELTARLRELAATHAKVKP